jgi:hypothetical protein
MAVTSVTEDQQSDITGNLIDVFVITFNLPDKPGLFTVTVPQSGDPVAAAQAAIAAKTQEVETMYGF